MDFWITQIFNGTSYGALLFLLAAGLTLIFGMMRIVNMTHGSYFLLGGYVGLTVIWRTGSFPLAILVAAVAIAALVTELRSALGAGDFEGARHEIHRATEAQLKRAFEAHAVTFVDVDGIGPGVCLRHH